MHYKSSTGGYGGYSGRIISDTGSGGAAGKQGIKSGFIKKGGTGITSGRRAAAREDDEQEALFEWAVFHAKSYPELRLMFHIPNGGARDYGTGIKLKRQGVKAGVPDIMLPAPRGSHAGLFIELKVGDNRPTVSQKHFLNALREAGYCCLVCYGSEEAITVIEAYLNGDIKRLHIYEDATADILMRVKEQEGPAL